jgi:hypothetical protein
VDNVDFVRIGLVHDDGLTLFRYSARIRRREWLKRGLGYVIMGALVGGPTALMLWNNTSIIASSGVLIGLVMTTRTIFRRSAVMRFRDEHGVFRTVRKRDLATLAIVRGEQPNAWWLSLATADGYANVVGEEALRVLRVALAASLSNISSDVVAEATRFLRDARFSSPMDVFAAVAQQATSYKVQAAPWGTASPGTVYYLPLYQRVALEIASTEALERAAALADAERATDELSDSEIIAEISDSMFPPAT